MVDIDISPATGGGSGGVISLNGLMGALSIVAGTGITVTVGVTTITITNSGVTSVTNSDGTITISPTTGNVVASLNLGHANTWTALQTFGNDISFGGAQLNVTSLTTGQILEYNGTNWINANLPGVGIGDADNVIMDNVLDQSGNPNPTFYVCEPPPGSRDGDSFDWTWTLPDPGHANVARRYKTLTILNAGTPGDPNITIRLGFVTNDGKRRLIGGPFLYRSEAIDYGSYGILGNVSVMQLQSFFSSVWDMWMWDIVSVSQLPIT